MDFTQKIFYEFILTIKYIIMRLLIITGIFMSVQLTFIICIYKNTGILWLLSYYLHDVDRANINIKYLLLIYMQRNP